MKKLVALLVALTFVSPIFAAEKAKTPAKPVVKKEVKHHKKVDGTTVAGTKPDTAPAKKK